MNILLNFIISICMFIYGMQLFSISISNMNYKLKSIFEKYSNNKFKGLILGTIITSIFQSSSIITSIVVSLVNSNVLTFHNSIGIIMGSNFGTCVTSWITSFLSNETSNSLLLNINTYTPITFSLGLIFYFKNKKNLSNILIGYSFFILGFNLMHTSLSPLMNYQIFKQVFYLLNFPITSLLMGIILTSILQSSSATIAILQMISKQKKLTYYMTIPIILGENIGSCITTIIAGIGTNKNAKKVAFAHLFYNIFGSIIFIIFFYISIILKYNYLYIKVNTNSIALIHTIFNFLSIIIFYPFTNLFEKFINKLIKKDS